jgi:hypothetical protein
MIKFVFERILGGITWKCHIVNMSQNRAVCIILYIQNISSAWNSMLTVHMPLTYIKPAVLTNKLSVDSNCYILSEILQFTGKGM